MPAVITRTAQRVCGIALTGSYLGAALRDGFHSADAHVRLLAVLGACHVLGHQSDERTFSTAVWLLGWQLNLYDIPFWHFIFF